MLPQFVFQPPCTSVISPPLLHTVGVLSDGFPMTTRDFLTQRGHEVDSAMDILGVVQGVAVNKEGNVEAYADYRKSGKDGHAVVVERTST